MSKPYVGKVAKMKVLLARSSMKDDGGEIDRFLLVATGALIGFPRGVIIVGLAGLLATACSEASPDAGEAGLAACREMIDEILDMEGVVRLPEGQE